MKSKPIILVGGTAGTGKTTLTNYLVCKYNFDHRIGTGFIREVARVYLPKQEFQSIHCQTFSPKNDIDILTHYINQCKLLMRPINACINRAKNEGTSLIVEGSNLIPSNIEFANIDLFIILTVSDRKILKKNLIGNTHKYRRITSTDFENIMKIQDYIIGLSNNIKSKKMILIDNINPGATKEKLESKFSSISERIT